MSAVDKTIWQFLRTNFPFSKPFLQWPASLFVKYFSGKVIFFFLWFVDWINSVTFRGFFLRVALVLKYFLGSLCIRHPTGRSFVMIFFCYRYVKTPLLWCSSLLWECGCQKSICRHSCNTWAINNVHKLPLPLTSVYVCHSQSGHVM